MECPRPQPHELVDRNDGEVNDRRGRVREHNRTGRALNLDAEGWTHACHQLGPSGTRSWVSVRHSSRVEHVHAGRDSFFEGHEAATCDEGLRSCFLFAVAPLPAIAGACWDDDVMDGLDYVDVEVAEARTKPLQAQGRARRHALGVGVQLTLN